MKHPEVERTIRKSMQRGGTMQDILDAVLNVFNEVADEKFNIKSEKSYSAWRDIKEDQKEVAAVTATAFYRAEELGV